MYTEQWNYMENSAKSKTGLETSQYDLAGSFETTDFRSVVFNFKPGPTLSFSFRAKRTGGVRATAVRSKLMREGHKVRGV